MKRNAFGAINLLIGLVITSIVFITMMNLMKGVGNGTGLNGTSIDAKSVQEHVDEQVNEIQNMRQQSIDYNQQYSEQQN